MAGRWRSARPRAARACWNSEGWGADRTARSAPAHFLLQCGTRQAMTSRGCHAGQLWANLMLISRLRDDVADGSPGRSRSGRMEFGVPHEDRRRSPHSLFHAADEPCVPEGTLSVLRPGIHDHHLPHRHRGAAQGGARAAGSVRAAGEVRIHPHAQLHRLRRLYRDRTGHPREVQRRGGRLCALHVPGRRGAHRRRPRAVGLPQEICPSQDGSGKGRALRPPPLWQDALRRGHHGLQARGGRQGTWS